MRALHFDKTLQLERDYPTPSPAPGEALIRTRLAGICNTDLEILRGYGGFTGVPGHEFVGEVVRIDDPAGAPGPDLTGQRVVGEINCSCGQCPTCRREDPGATDRALERLFSPVRPTPDGPARAGPDRENEPGRATARGTGSHCPHRTTLGIYKRDGVMADFFTLPARLLHPVPDAVSDRQAVFVEPLAAACRILEQVDVRPHHRVVVLGDGKLGLLIAQVLQLTGCRLLVVGRHSHKLAILAARGIRAQLATEPLEPGADVVIEATGNAEGFATAQSLVRPRGTLVLKSTFHGEMAFDPSRIVVDEITLIGSRCGPFAPALRLLAEGLVDVEPLIHGRFSLDEGPAAFERAASGVLKVLLSP